MKSVILDGYTVNAGDLSWEAIESAGSLTVYDRTKDSEITDRIGDCDVVFTSKCHITREVMDSCPGIKFIGVMATGYDNVDIEAAKDKNIAVCNVPSYFTESVAQHTFALLLELCNRVGLHNDAVQDGKWSTSADFSLVISPMFQLSGKTMGIIGYGAIGKRVGQIAEAFGMEVVPYSRDPERAVKADVISLHCPATPGNKGFIDKDFISQMKDGAYLINTARGALINERDLADAVKSGKLSGAAVDVVSREPIDMENPLLGIENLLITGHMAWTSKEARQIVCSTCADNLKAFMNGEELNRIV